MECYKTFASVYDSLMSDVDYAMWYKYLLKIWEKYNHRPKLVLDLGCGTGTLSVMLAKGGYDVIGVDASAEMLSVAASKAEGRGILFLNQPMERFELYGTVDGIISFFDCINYILSADKLFRTFKLAENYLNDGGLFVFDINTCYKYKKILGNNVFAQDGNTCSYIWENCYDGKINEYALHLFIKNDDGLYKKTTEYHYQRAYSKRCVGLLLRKAGFNVLGVFDAYTFNKPKLCSERMFFVAEKKGVRR